MSGRQIASGSDTVRRMVLLLPELQDSQSIFVYASAGSEVQTYALIEDLLALRKTVAVPHIIDAKHRQMQATVIRSPKALVPDPHYPDLLTPGKGEPLSGSPDLSLLPGLAFSPLTGTRLGMGGGYYDRFFGALRSGGFRVGLAFEQQLQDELPAEAHDHPVHAIVTPERVYRIIAQP